MAYLQDSALDDERPASKLPEHRAKGVPVPSMHEAMQKWYYKDPQGEIQGGLFCPTPGPEGSVIASRFCKVVISGNSRSRAKESVL